MERLIGSENCTQLRTALLLERFELFRFIGKTLLIASDVPGDFLNHRGASVLKALVGGDPLWAEAKGSNEGFDLIGNFNVLITSNSRLRVRLDGDCGAWRRRLIIIRFQNPPAVRIDHFADRLIADEGPGILKWAVDGLLKAQKEISSIGDLRLVPEQQGRVDALLSESDSLRQFVRECTERTSRGLKGVTTTELVEAYYQFCNNRQWMPLTIKMIERGLTDVMLETWGVSQSHNIQRERTQVRGWSGIALKCEATPAPTQGL